MTAFRVKKATCQHDWTPGDEPGFLDKTERRDCRKCKRIQTREPGSIADLL